MPHDHIVNRGQIAVQVYGAPGLSSAGELAAFANCRPPQRTTRKASGRKKGGTRLAECHGGDWPSLEIWAATLSSKSRRVPWWGLAERGDSGYGTAEQVRRAHSHWIGVEGHAFPDQDRWQKLRADAT
jgi:hypothetical protein